MVGRGLGLLHPGREVALRYDPGRKLHPGKPVAREIRRKPFITARLINPEAIHRPHPRHHVHHRRPLRDVEIIRHRIRRHLQLYIPPLRDDQIVDRRDPLLRIHENPLPVGGDHIHLQRPRLAHRAWRAHVIGVQRPRLHLRRARRQQAARIRGVHQKHAGIGAIGQHQRDHQRTAAIADHG